MEGTFDLKKCTANMALSGMGIEVSLVIPNKKTSITIEYVSEFPYSVLGTNPRKLQLMIVPVVEGKPTWEEILRGIGLPAAPRVEVT